MNTTPAAPGPLPLTVPCCTALLLFGIGLNGAVAQEAAKSSAGGEQTQEAELAKKLANPVADLISAPLQSNFDFGGGPDGDGFQYKLNIQPVIPITLNDNWNVISRTILPVIYQDNIVGNSSQSGLGDTTASLFLSPKEPGPGGWIWGVGPVFLIPTATDGLLGSEKFGLGPTVVLLKQTHGWTYGALANQIWSVAGNDNRASVNATFLQPFIAYTTKKQTTFTLNSESTYDWQDEQWTVPINLMIAQLVKVGKVPVQFQIGGRYYAETPENGPDWGLRFAVTLLFPK